MKKSIVVIAAAILSACCVFTACGKVADNTEHFDKITKTMKLEKSFEGKNLMSDDGIGVATLIGDTTDGDTSDFSLAIGGSVTVRYQGVDTPESTADVEKWGKAASKFTNERLHLATEIVLESASGGVPEKESVGQRYLCYVWYKTAEDDFKCLNLELVENGYSKNKESADNAYYSYFQKAEKFARGIELRMFSKLEDPLYDTTIYDLSLKQLHDDPDSFKEDIRVRFDAYCSDMYVASSGAVTFTLAQYDETTGNIYEISLYVGHNKLNAKMQVGDLYYVLGMLQKHNGSWQLSGINLDNEDKGNEKKTWRRQFAYCCTFDASGSLYTNKRSYNCYGDLTVTSATTEGSALTFTGTAPDLDGETETFTFTVNVPEGTTSPIAVGSKLAIKRCFKLGEGDTYTVVNYSDINLK